MPLSHSSRLTCTCGQRRPREGAQPRPTCLKQQQQQQPKETFSFRDSKGPGIASTVCVCVCVLEVEVLGVCSRCNMFFLLCGCHGWRGGNPGRGEVTCET